MIRAGREAKGWSMSQFANELRDAGLPQMHPTTVGRIERHERPLRLDEAVSMAATLGIDLAAMLGIEPPPPPTLPVLLGSIITDVTLINGDTYQVALLTANWGWVALDSGNPVGSELRLELIASWTDPSLICA